LIDAPIFDFDVVDVDKFIQESVGRSEEWLVNNDDTKAKLREKLLGAE